MNRRHMIGDHHGRTAGGTTLLVRAMDGILGTHRAWMPGRASVSALVAGMVMTLGPSSAQVSVTWARYPVQRVTWLRRA